MPDQQKFTNPGKHNCRVKGLRDKKFVFVPNTIVEENLSFIDDLGPERILHP